MRFKREVDTQHADILQHDNKLKFDTPFPNDIHKLPSWLFDNAVHQHFDTIISLIRERSSKIPLKLDILLRGLKQLEVKSAN